MKFALQLQQIMNHFGLSTTELADKISVPKATISHLISERNKPSLEFIMKLHTHFPELNLEWLIYEKEPFLITGIHQEKKETAPTLLADFSEKETEQIQKEEIPLHQENIPLYIEPENKRENFVEIPQNVLSSATETSSQKIESIVVFYSDGSFKRYIQQ